MDEKFNGINNTEKWKNVTLIDKGWSSDEKYYIETDNGQQLLLRLSNISEYRIKKRDYELLEHLYNDSIPMSKPKGFGVCGNNKFVYTLFTWIDGEDVEGIISKLSRKEQYDLGVVAGKILRKIHGVETSFKSVKWEKRFNKKIDEKIKRYASCPIKFEGADAIIDYINQNRSLLKGRRQVLQHGDYHIGNMILTKEGSLGIIDFNRLDFGDPWEEFNRITFCAGISEWFASGRINGYFVNNIPDTFFRLMALYIGCNQLSSIPWAIPFGEDDISFMLEQAEKVMDWYNGYKSYIPSWYVSREDI